MTDIEHFLTRFVPNVTYGLGCWEWMGPRTTRGYGQVRRGERSPIGAHRYSWEMTTGLIPPGLLVCHRCDNKLCVKPSHLFLGTVRDNNLDSIRKNRHRWAGKSCSQGHPYDEVNLNIYHYRGQVWRRCRTCRRLRNTP